MMNTGERNVVNSMMRPGWSLLLLTSYFLLLTVFLSSCGRRGDPVAISPYEENDSVEKSEVLENEKMKPDISGTGEEELTVLQPKAPKGLAAIFTGKKIILVWDEIIGQGVEFYRVYRSGGNGFSLIAEVVTPVCNDGDIESGARYFYKVSAVGQSESSVSDTVEVVTGGD